MLNLKVCDNFLLIEPDDLEALADAKDIHEALETHLCNGWNVVLPEQCGALTDGLILTEDWDEDDQGNLTRLGTVYWDSDYQITDALAELKAGRNVMFAAVK